MTNPPIFFSLLVILTGCAVSTHQQGGLPSTKESELTVGIVQKQIHKGMDQAEVAASLGSPNIVTKDKQDKETWIYDKIASEVSYSKSEGYGTLLLIGISKKRVEASSTQKTLTVIIKFDKDQLVETFSYHYSKF